MNANSDPESLQPGNGLVVCDWLGFTSELHYSYFPWDWSGSFHLYHLK